MELNDKKRFIQIMMGVADNFRDKISNQGLSMRFDMLKGYKIEQIDAAAKQIMIARKYTKMPTIAEFFEILQGGEQDRALSEANNIVIHLTTHGTSISPQCEDPTTKYLMEKRWPYQNWAAKILESEIKWWIKEFTEAYLSYQKINTVPQIENSNRMKKLIVNIGGTTCQE